MTLYIFPIIFLPLLFICFEFIFTINNIKLSTNIIVLAKLINKFQKNKRKNYIPINKEDSPQIIKMCCCASLHKMDFMVKNIHKHWSIIY
jgi:hypothetical protein